ARDRPRRAAALLRQARRVRLCAAAGAPPAPREPGADHRSRTSSLRRVTEPVLRIHQTRSRANPGGMDPRTVLGEEVLPFRSRKPEWFKVPAPGGDRYRRLRADIAA